MRFRVRLWRNMATKTEEAMAAAVAQARATYSDYFPGEAPWYPLHAAVPIDIRSVAGDGMWGHDHVSTGLLQSEMARRVCNRIAADGE